VHAERLADEREPRENLLRREADHGRERGDDRHEHHDGQQQAGEAAAAAQQAGGPAQQRLERGGEDRRDEERSPEGPHDVGEQGDRDREEDEERATRLGSGVGGPHRPRRGAIEVRLGRRLRLLHAHDSRRSPGA
jgi:hypothetical protein